jgi:hypothetical protein
MGTRIREDRQGKARKRKSRITLQRKGRKRLKGVKGERWKGEAGFRRERGLKRTRNSRVKGRRDDT